MALLFIDGFDAGDMAVKGWTLPGNCASGTSPATRFGVGRWGSVNAGALSVIQFTASAQLFVGIAMANTYYDANVRTYISFLGDNGASQHLSMGISNSAFVVYRGALGSALLASHNLPIAQGVFYHFEISATIHATTGNVTVKMNGATIINFTGNTKNGGTNTTIDTFGLGANGGVTSYFDDLYICNDTGPAPNNTFLGDVRVHTLVPNGAGSSTQMTPSSGANYTTVDEIPYSATDYVQGLPGQKDLYTMSDLPANTGTIYGVQANSIVKKTDAGPTPARTVLKSGSTTSNGSTVYVGTTDRTLSLPLGVNPDTSSGWSSGAVNSLEIGTEAV